MEGTKTRWTERMAKAVLAAILACGLTLPTAALMTQPERAWGDETWHVNDTDANTDPAWVHVNSNITSSANPAASANLMFRAYKLFNAEVGYPAEDATNNTIGDPTITHIDWAAQFTGENSSKKDSLLAFLRNASLSGATTALGNDVSNPQDVAEYIGGNIGTATTAIDTSSNMTPDRKSHNTFAAKLTDMLTASSVSYTSINANEDVMLSEGYWLIVSDPSSLVANYGGTAPIWIALQGDASTEKDGIRRVNAKETNGLTVTWKVKEDSSGTWNDASADANRYQDVEFEIWGSLPSNFSSYTSFVDKYVITLPAGLEYKTTEWSDASVEVRSTSGDASDGASIGSAIANVKDTTSNHGGISGEGNKTLTLYTTDIHATNSVTAAHCVVVRFKAHLDRVATSSGATYRPAVVRTHTSDPVASGDAGSNQENDTLFGNHAADSTASIDGPLVYTYKATATKRDKNNSQPLEGAKFVVMANTDVAAGAGSSMYVLNDSTNGHTGQLVEAPSRSTAVGNEVPNASWATSTTTETTSGSGIHLSDLVFTSDPNGVIEIDGLDQGTYTFIEIAVPTRIGGQYEFQNADLVLTLNASTPGTLYAGNTTSGSTFSYITGGETRHAGGNEVVFSLEIASGSSARAMNFNIPNIRTITMPLTGLPGYVGLAIVGIVLVVGGFGGIFLVRRARNRKVQM